VTPFLFGTLVVGLSFAFGSAVRRARRDWVYRLRLTLVFGHLEWTESPQFSPELSEVVIEAPFEAMNCTEVVLVRVYRSSERLLFRLDDRAGHRAQLCARWYDSGVPLLLVTEHRGAVLHGPGGLFLGQLVPHGAASPNRVESTEWQ
jgi:hypothetical protein